MRSAAVIGLAAAAGASILGCDEAQILVVVPDLPRSARWVGAIVSIDEQRVASTGLLPAGAPILLPFELEPHEGIAISILAFDERRLAAHDLPSEEVLADEPLTLATPEGSRLPRPIWLGRGALTQTRVEVNTVEDGDLAVSASWVPECSVHACRLMPFGRPSFIEVPGRPSRAAFATRLEANTAFIGTGDGRFFTFTPGQDLVPATALSTSATPLAGERLADGRIALLSVSGGLSIGALDRPFRSVASTGALHGALSASLVEPSEVFISSPEGRLHRWTDASGLVSRFERVGMSGRTEVAWIGPEEVVAAFEGEGLVVWVRGASVEEISLEGARIVGRVGSTTIVATNEDTQFGRGGVQVFRLDGTRMSPLLLDSGLSFTPRRLAPVDEQSFLLGGWRGQLGYFHLSAEESCLVGGVPYTDLNDLVVLEDGLLAALELTDDTEPNRVLLYLPRRDVPPVCPLE